MTTTKRSYAARLGMLALALTLMTTCLLGGTMAKYTTEVTGDGSATVAKWSFKANGGTSTMTAITLADATSTNVAADRIAPGSEGSFNIEIDASGSEVAIDYAIKLSNSTNMPANLKFYSDAAMKSEITLSDDVADLTGTIAVTDTKTVTKTVYWGWAGTGGDTSDTTAGSNTATPGTFDITVTGTQKTS